MKNESIWMMEQQNNITPALNKDISTDVLIIGGGLTGISTAYHLIDKGLDVTLVEMNEIGSGITSRTTGKLTYLQEDLLSKINCYHGEHIAKKYLESQVYAINLVKDIIEKENIACNLEQTRSYLFDTSDFKLKKEIKLLKKFNVKLNMDSLNSCRAYYVDDTFVFHPLKYLFKLKEFCVEHDIKIYENTKIEKIEKDDDNYICYTDKHQIKTKYIIIASHYPYFLIPFPLPFKSYIEKSYIKAFKVEENKKQSAINLTKPTISIRYHSNNNDNYELYLTNSHNLCIKNNDYHNFKELKDKHSTNPSFIWSNTDIMTNDSIPFIGPISKDKRILLGTGYNTWGMTNASLAGEILANLILNKDHKYAKLFNPKRSINIGKIINLPLILGSNIYAIINTKISKNKKWYSPHVKFETRKGKNVGIYTDENNKEHIVYNLCPHLKCSLIFNEIEKTWECPCHSSKFDIDGKCISGPSKYDISYKQ